MGLGEPAYAGSQRLEIVLPARRIVVDHGVSIQLVHQHLDHPVEQLLATRDVSIQRHRLHAEPGTELSHGEPFEALFVDEPDGLTEDGHLTERSSAPRFATPTVLADDRVHVGAFRWVFTR